jgi:hypothetical protein
VMARVAGCWLSLIEPRYVVRHGCSYRVAAS